MQDFFRIQSLFTILAVITLGTLYFLNLGEINSPDFLLNICWNGVFNDATNESIITLWPLASSITVTFVLVFLSMFMFRNRLLQIRVLSICMALCIAIAIIIVATNVIVARDCQTDWNIHWSLAMPIVATILLGMAKSKVQKDEAIIRSLNRLR